MSDFLRLLENEVQIAALAFLVVVYIIRIIWLLRFRPVKERTFPAGEARTGIAHSMMNIAMPWAMESTRKNPLFYAQFVIFHLGVTAAIAATFIIPYGPKLFTVKAVAVVFQAVIAAALLTGLLRLYRRLSSPRMRLISTVDDYFSIVLMILFFASGLLSVANRHRESEWPLFVFFGLTALLLVYVPFSKIGHYLYYPVLRFILGRSLGHRGYFGELKKGRRRSGPEGGT